MHTFFQNLSNIMKSISTNKFHIPKLHLTHIASDLICQISYLNIKKDKN